MDEKTKSRNELVSERFVLCAERIAQIAEEQDVPEQFKEYFAETAKFICNVLEFEKVVRDGRYKKYTVEKMQEINSMLYSNILENNYATAYENPSYAAKQLTLKHGKVLSSLSARLYELIFDAAEKKRYPMTLLMELFIEVYCLYEDFSDATYAETRKAIKSFQSDNYPYYQEDRLYEMYNPQYTFARDIIMNADYTNTGYIYQYGEYITDNERQIAEFINRMDEASVRAMADTCVDGYIRGFETMGVKLKENGNVLLRFPIGFERMVYYCIDKLEKNGFTVSMGRCTLRGRTGRKGGYAATNANPQFDYDHRNDKGIYYDKVFMENTLVQMKKIYEAQKDVLAKYIGPMIIETFGEEIFEPQNKAVAVKLDKRQIRLTGTDIQKSNEIAYKYIKSDETSFTIIAYPLPSIGEKFEEIFWETVKVNNLSNDEYHKIQQCIIDELDTGTSCHILGRNGNETDLTVSLRKLNDPSKETIFENCTADVNIPVGEVFTSPVLAGTTGLLHVSKVFLNGYEYKNLKVRFKDGRTTELACENFEKESENQEFLKENLLKNHESLPLGEFAIGTNTTAFMMGKKYNIDAYLPILIAEKTGPHFAIGDTCYSRNEDHKVYNKDGKEIIARDNEISALRNEKPAEAYFNCHTDITIPYGEIGEISSVKPDGSKTDIIRDGRFVLKGTESLNIPLDEK